MSDMATRQANSLSTKVGKSDAQFMLDKLNFSALVTVDWSGNERTLDYSKLLSTLKRRLKPGMSPAH